MKTVLVLSVLLCAAFAAPAEDKLKAPAAAVEAPKEQSAAAPETEDKMMKKDEASVPEDSVPVPRNARLLEEAAAPESRFNFCPDGWFGHGSRCYRFVSIPMTWYNAEEHCNSLGASLASATNSRDYRFLQQITGTAETEDKMMKKDEASVPEDSVPDPRNARFNFCPDGWFGHGSRCYRFVNSPMNWYNAEEHCNSLGASLASATNSRDYRFLQQLTGTAGQTIAWLGGFNLQGRWMWIDREGFYYTNWYSQSSPSSSPCIYLRSSSGWGNTACSSSYRFICSKNPFDC